MSRTLSVATEAALAATQVRLAVFVELQFGSGTLNLCNAGHDLVWDAKTWLGMAEVGDISALSEGVTLEARGLELTLSGVKAANIAIALGEHYQGLPAYVWVAPLDANYAAIADPVGPWRFRMDTMSGTLADEGSISLTLESRWARWETPNIRRYNDADQQVEYPGDLGMQYVERMANLSLIWPA